MLNYLLAKASLFGENISAIGVLNSKNEFTRDLCLAIASTMLAMGLAYLYLKCRRVDINPLPRVDAMLINIELNIAMLRIRATDTRANDEPIMLESSSQARSCR
jgi:hypothetical protein